MNTFYNVFSATVNYVKLYSELSLFTEKVLEMFCHI